jgi:putative peptidoglycan lipid II flippase
MALLLVPATAGYLVLSKPLIQTLLEHGVMRGGSSDLVASVLDMFAVGIFPFAAFLLFMRAFYARQDARTPLVVNVVENVVTIALDFVLFPHMRVAGLALAHSVGYVVGAVLAAVLLARRVGGLESRKTLIELLKVSAATGVAALVMVVVLAVLGAAIGTGPGQAPLRLAAGGVTGLATFIAAARMLAVEELGLIRKLLPGLPGRRGVPDGPEQPR